MNELSGPRTFNAATPVGARNTTFLVVLFLKYLGSGLPVRGRPACHEYTFIAALHSFESALEFSVISIGVLGALFWHGPFQRKDAAIITPVSSYLTNRLFSVLTSKCNRVTKGGKTIHNEKRKE